MLNYRHTAHNFRRWNRARIQIRTTLKNAENVKMRIGNLTKEFGRWALSNKSYALQWRGGELNGPPRAPSNTLH